MQITAENLCKKFGERAALEGVSLSVRAGEALAVFGRSGAGKSVLLRLLAGILAPDSGSVTSGARRLLPLAPDPNLTPAEALQLAAVLGDVAKSERPAVVRETLSLLGVLHERFTRIRLLSCGTRKLVEVGCVLVASPDVLLLDEPTAGLDYAARRLVLRHLLALRLRGRSVVIATSRPEDAEACDRVLMLHEGRAVACGSVQELRLAAGMESITLEPKGRSEGPRIVMEDDGEITAKLAGALSGGAVRLRPAGLDTVLDELIDGKNLRGGAL
ncbi:MAG: ATP-binding cassette domain-containing protein [Armatimonadota bacterium]